MIALQRRGKGDFAMKMKAVFLSAVMVSSLFVSGAVVAPSARAAAYPEDNKIIEFVNHSSAGSGAALYMLTCGDILNRTGIVKAKIQVVHRQGGSSAVALNYVHSKKGDPYYVNMWTTAQLMAMNRGATVMKFPEVTWLTTLVEDGNVVIVPYESSYKSIAELIAAAKANPKKVSVGVNSIGGSEHIMATRIARVTGVRFNTTSFEFSPTQLIGGHIDMAFGSVAETSGHVKAKRARVLANMGEHRLPYYKDIPTLKEQGIDASFTQYRGFMSGPNFPAEAIKFWDEAFTKLIKTKEFADFANKSDYILAFKSAAETKAFVPGYNDELLKDAKFIDENK
jgi:putative tricarboxylic transport membrane protein